MGSNVNDNEMAGATVVILGERVQTVSKLTSQWIPKRGRRINVHQRCG
jgi:hypothetical protein